MAKKKVRADSTDLSDQVYGFLNTLRVVREEVGIRTIFVENILSQSQKDVKELLRIGEGLDSCLDDLDSLASDIDGLLFDFEAIKEA